MFQLQCEVRPGYWEDYQEPVATESAAKMCLTLFRELYPWFKFRIKP